MSGLIFYRCVLCGGIVNEWNTNDEGCCPKCGGTKVRPTNLTFWEKIVQLLKHPKWWEWKEQEKTQLESHD